MLRNIIDTIVLLILVFMIGWLGWTIVEHRNMKPVKLQPRTECWGGQEWLIYNGHAQQVWITRGRLPVPRDCSEPEGFKDDEPRE